MKPEKLKQKHTKRNIIIGITTITVLTASIITFTKASFRTTESIPLVNGTINYDLADNNLVGVYINSDSGYTKSDTIPESGYVLNEEESYCTVNGERDDTISLSYNVDTKSLSVTPMTTRGTKCYLYFDEKQPANAQELIASKNLAIRDSFSSTLTTDTTGTIYYADTSKGRTYYFAGNPTDNWVRWAGFYWRIIRINEDGTIRMIYQGTSANTTGSNTQTQTSAFNSSYNNNMYVGYMYQSNQPHGLTSSSTIKGILDTWYQNNLARYADDLDGNAGFCGDRTPYSGTGTSTTYYGAYNRLNTNKAPTFECASDSDLYTTSGSEDGNGALTYPIGLITADEVAYAGGVYGTNNTSYYLYTNSSYWTMSPYEYPNASVFDVRSTGRLIGGNYVTNTFGVRPVVNLKADTQFSSGNGTSETPFVVS